MTTVNMGTVADLVQKAGIQCFITTTGGGVHTLFAGVPDEVGYSPCLVGPFDQTLEADFAELWAGPEWAEGDDTGLVDLTAVGARTAEDVAKIVIWIAEHDGSCTFDEISALGFDGTCRSTDPAVMKSREAVSEWCDIYNAELKKARDAGKTTADAVAAATLNANHILGGMPE